MEALRERTGSSPAGRRLLKLLQLQQARHRDELAEAVLAVLTEGGNPAQHHPNGGSVAAGVPRADMAAALAVIPGLQCIQPRGKCDVGLFKEQLVIAMPKQDIGVPYSAIQTVAILDRVPGDTKGRILLCLHLDKAANVMNGKTALGCILLQTTAKAELDIPNPAGSGRLQGPAAVVLSSVLGLLGTPAICAPSLDVFRTSKREPAVAANIKVSTGFLYPMAAGLCFVERPATFVPKGNISSVEFARAGGGSATFDFMMHTKDGDSVEFGQLPQEELPALTAYAQRQGLPLGAPADEESDADEGGTSGELNAKGSAAASKEDAHSGDSDAISDEEDFEFAPGLDAGGDADDNGDDDSDSAGGTARGPQAASGSDADSGDASDDASDAGDEEEVLDMSDSEKADMAASTAQAEPPSKRRRR